MVGIAQLVRAPDCGSGCRGFESHYPPHTRGEGPERPLRPFPPQPSILGCSQVVRHGTLTPAFAGSSPAIPATSSVRAAYRSPCRQRQVSFTSPHLLSPPNPLRWASAGTLCKGGKFSVFPQVFLSNCAFAVFAPQRHKFGVFSATGVSSSSLGKAHRTPHSGKQGATTHSVV